MKKLKGLIFSFLVLMVSFTLVACGGKGDKNNNDNSGGTTTLTTPVANAVVNDGTYYAENKLSTVSLSATAGDTAGSFVWVNPDTILLVGENEYDWKFVPDDKLAYSEITGKVKVTAIEQNIIDINVKDGFVASGYKAFDEFDTTGLVIVATYDGGKTEEITEGYTVSYLDDKEMFYAGDDYVEFGYAGLVVSITVEEVAKIEVEVPTVEGEYIYSGSAQTAVLTNIENAGLYNAENKTQTNAGDYNISLTLKDADNYKWVDKDTATATIPFVISKADQTITKHSYKGVYDGEGHEVYVESNIESDDYYYHREIDITNYQHASTAPYTFDNATVETKIYYFVLGNDNYNDATGYVTVEIEKTSATVVAKNAYAVEVEGKKANLPLSYVKVNGQNSDMFDADEFVFVYYTSYTDEVTNTKTTSVEGAETDGGAPSKAGTYYVKTVFDGSINYNQTFTISTLVIDENNSTLFAHSENAFDWKNNSTKDYVSVRVDSSLELATMVVDARIGGEIVEGYVYREAETTYVVIGEITYIATFDAEFNKLTLTGKETLEFDKFVLPLYLGEYQRDMNGDGDYISVLTINNYYGEIQFVINAYFDDSGEMVNLNQTGIVSYSALAGKLNFLKYNASVKGYEQFFTADYTEGEAVTSLQINRNNTPPNFGGEYTKI